MGLSAGSFTNGSSGGSNVPTAAEASAFLRDYEEFRLRPFSGSERRTAAATLTWVLAYNARCAVSFLPPGGLPANGSSLHALETHGDAYFDLRW